MTNTGKRVQRDSKRSKNSKSMTGNLSDKEQRLLQHMLGKPLPKKTEEKKEEVKDTGKKLSTHNPKYKESLTKDK